MSHAAENSNIHYERHHRAGNLQNFLIYLTPSDNENLAGPLGSSWIDFRRRPLMFGLSSPIRGVRAYSRTAAGNRA